MDTNGMTRKEFFVLTFTLVGGGAVAASCSDDDNNGGGGQGGNISVGTGRGGRGGSTSTGGSGGSTSTGGSGGGNAAACGDPLPESQVPDSTGHMHSVEVSAATLNSTSSQTFTTNIVENHQHMVTLTPGDLSTIKGGGQVTVMSSIANSHLHSFMVRCT
jgi:hypothetical protein